MRKNDLEQQLKTCTQDFRNALKTRIRASADMADRLFQDLLRSENPPLLATMARIWSRENLSAQMMEVLMDEFERDAKTLEQILKAMHKEDNF